MSLEPISVSSTSAHYDVVVVGGGSAGITAAVQSARAGAKTLLVEKSACLGGATTSGGINFPGLFHAWGKQVIAGIGWELVQGCAAETGLELPDFTVVPERHWQHQILVDRAIYTALCDELVVASGCTILFHAMVAKVHDESDGVALTLCTKTGLHELRCGVVIDCTGDANVAELAGCALERSSQLQPCTYSCQASGYDPKVLDMKAINAAFGEAVSAGELKCTDASWSMDVANAGSWLSKFGNNANHIGGIDAGTSEGKTAAELEGRRAILRMYRFLKRQPGLEHLRIDFLSNECGVRDTARIIGETRVEVDDYISGRLWPDALCYSFYPIDLHTSSDHGLTKRMLAPGVIPSIPLSAMIPRGYRHVLVAGRCVASDPLAHSALRVQASCMAMGQACGAVAALSSREHCAVTDIELGSVRTLLTQHAAIVPGL